MTPAVPVVPPALDPRHPEALGYDPSDVELARARREAARDPDLALAFEARLRRETARFRAWAERYRRQGAGGVALSGATVGPFAPTHPGELLAEVRREQAARAARREQRTAFWRFTREMLEPPALTAPFGAGVEEG